VSWVDHTIRGEGNVLISLINEGTITADVANKVLRLTNTLTNFNSATNTLTGGTFGAANGGLLQFNDANIDINQAEIILDGAGSTIVNQTGVDALPDLAVNDTGAALRVLGNRDFTTTADFTNRGELELGGGTFNANSIDNQAAGLADSPWATKRSRLAATTRTKMLEQETHLMLEAAATERTLQATTSSQSPAAHAILAPSQQAASRANFRLHLRARRPDPFREPWPWSTILIT